MQSPTDTARVPQETKEPYRRPNLSTYGGFQDLTADKSGSKGDGAKVPQTMT